MANRTLTLMAPDKYWNLIMAYEASFKGQTREQIQARYRNCEIACQRSGALDSYILRRSAKARYLLANMYAMQDAAPWLD